MPIRYLSSPPRSADLVIIGGGVAGAATAFWARRAGLESVVLERRGLPCTLTTPASTGAFRLQFDNLEELQLVRESVRLFLNFREMTSQSDYDLDIRQQGYLWLTTGDSGVERQRALVARQHAWGQEDVELLDGDATRQRFPYVGENVLQARFRGDDGFLDPKQLTFGLLAASGVQVVTRCEVTGFRMTDNRLTAVETSGGQIAAERSVIAAGPFSGLVAALAGVDLPIETVLRQKMVIPHEPLVPGDAPMTIDDDTGAHWRPALRGAFVLFTDPATPPSPPTEDITPEHTFAMGLLDPGSASSVARVAPFWRRVWERGSVSWIVQGGQYTMTPDHRPLIGPTPVEGLFVNTGYSGHGIMGSPAGSRILVDVLTGKIQSEDNPFRLDRVFAHRDLDVL